jgi:Arc/MetJ-type ribon-helix-helix transcriptional regulator
MVNLSSMTRGGVSIEEHWIEHMKLHCISITPDLACFVVAKVALGRHQTTSEVFHAGLRLLERKEGAASPGQPTVPCPERRARPKRA